MYQGALVAMQRHLNCSFLIWGRNGGPPDGTRIVHHETDELLIQQNTILDGETASVQERSQSLCRFLSHLMDMFRPGEPFIEGHPKIKGIINPLDWLPEELYCSGFRDAPTGLGEERRRALRDIYDDPPFTQPLP